MDLPIKIKEEEPADHYILSTLENETAIGSSCVEHSKTGKVKQEPSDDSLNSEYAALFEVEYLDDDSETEQMLENRTNCSSNLAESKKLRTRTTPAQFTKMLEFIGSHSDGANTMNGARADADDAWNILTNELNDIGPPYRTKAGWRRAWSVFKYNQQRRKLAASAVNGGVKRMRLETSADRYDVLSTRPSSLDDADATSSSSSKNLPHTTDDDIPNSGTNGQRDRFEAVFLKKMDSIVVQQIRHSNQLERLNKNLEKLIDVLTDKFT